MMGAALAERSRALAYSSRTAVAMVVAALLVLTAVLARRWSAPRRPADFATPEECVAAYVEACADGNPEP